ncbi:MAG: MBL fold metallo-hydrolase [Acidobacteria bacterium]|nr:MBL fold metallo-hydrolase [Acidobacteriota bacterium]MBU4308054.1 MBL fold metallo-hydrolase [Acidobacteriota bacterium]MBU4405489.1 MBL fold metallo-hydrolase [Acidobacteriota bacterium]MCG2810080.1 MBL fold metallo-hydrolase [Candidatus Aminicenantes bacterium]
MKITILVDNRIARPELRAEHGLALWIESEGKRILFDTGQGGALGKNAKILGVDLGKTDIIVLSHGHYDHSGGMAQVMKRAKKVELYCHPGVIQPRYSISDGIATPVHMPQPSLVALDRLPPTHIHWLQQPLMLSAQIGLSGPIPRKTSYEDSGGPFYLDLQGKRPDPLSDDLALWMQTGSGLVVCVGCSHAGLVNTLNHVRRLNNGQKIRAVIGGFHLRNASSDRLAQTIAALRQLEPDMVVPCHCSGELAVAELRNALGERISMGAAGMIYQF